MKKVLLLCAITSLGFSYSCFDLQNEVDFSIQRAKFSFERNVRYNDACNYLFDAEMSNREIILNCRMLNGKDHEIRKYINFLKKEFRCKEIK
jgi:hypothetical protein